MNELNSQIILDGVDKLSNGKLKFRDDLERLINVAVINKKIDLLEKISFDAKFVTGLIGVIQKKNDKIDVQYFDKAVSEYKEGIERIKLHLTQLISFTSDFYKSIFAEKFLGMTQSSLQNLNSLCADLSFLKLFFNDQKFNR